jgi:acyl carrier protein
VRELLIEQGKDRAARSLTLHSSFQRDLGLASLDLVELVIRCETRLELELPDEIAEQADTPAGWVKAIQQGSQDTEAKSAYRIVPPSGDAPAVPHGARDFAEVLRRHAEHAPGRIHIHLIEEGKGQGITCSQLLQSATTVARGLCGQGLRRDDRVAILLPNSAEFFEAFFGAVLAGGIPVPLYPPESEARLGEYIRGQSALLANVGARCLIAFDAVHSASRIMRVAAPGLDVTTVEQLRRVGTKAPARLPEPSEYALIQYTSGSTGEPKAVALTHAAILANLRAIGARLAVTGADAVVSWLPLASDMGLVGSWLFSLYHGAPLTQLSPREFQTRPESWLWAIHDSRGTLSAAPNSAYERCTRQIPLWTLEGIDLSAWRVAAVAGEQVLASTLERFTRRFAFTGLDSAAMLPCYGLAENSVALAMPAVGDGAVRRHANGAVSVGTPLESHEARVVHPDEHGEGRLEFRSPTVCSGYWSGGKLIPVASPEGWVDSGDLAIVDGGEIFVTGRAKDTIIKEGRSLAPLPIEAAVSDVAGVRLGAAVAIGVPDAATGTERLVVVAESGAERSDLPRVRAGIAHAVAAAIAIPPDDIVLIPPGTLPRTSNGKQRRAAVRGMYQSGALGAEPAAPWLQMTGLWFSNLPALSSRGFARALSASGRALTRALAFSVAMAGGCLTRLPGLNGLVGPVSRMILSIVGRSPKRYGDAPRGAAVIAANRTSPLDPLSLVALVSERAVLCGDDAVLGLRGAPRFLLQPAVIPRDGCRHALRAGRTVLLFPDAPVGAPPRRCRFRLEALDAAVEERVPIVPAAVVEIEGRTVVRFGPRLEAGGVDARTLRDRIRAAIAGLFA